MKLRLKLFLTLEYVLFILSFVFLYKFNQQPLSISKFIFFALTLFILSNLSVFINTSNKITTQIGIPIIIPAIIILGPFWSSLVTLIGTIPITKLKNNFVWYKFIFNQTIFFLATGCAALTFEITKSFLSTPYFFLPLLIANVIFFVINNGSVFLVMLIENYNQDFSVLLYFLKLTKNIPIVYFLGLLFYYTYINLGQSFLILGIVLIYFSKDILYAHIKRLNHYTQIVESFLKVIDSKDNYTKKHCERVSEYAEIVCRQMQLKPSKANQIVQMAKIHDIGKICIPDSILKATGHLTDEQYEKMKDHSNYGYELLQDIELISSNLDLIRYHHEHYDGKGYPEGLIGKDIPLGARVLATCDAFEVMTNGRLYKPPMTKEKVLAEFKECSGTQFDPQISKLMINLIEAGEFDYIFKDNIEKYEEEYDVAVNFN